MHEADNHRNPAQVKAVPGQLRVSGDACFYTLQGEGLSLGEPAVFLRLHLCNLHCTWCDTPYTWNPDDPRFWTEAALWTPEEAAERTASCWGCEDPGVPRRLVITGGEPLVQKESIDLLIGLLPEWTIELETNGTLIPTDLQLERCFFNCSPKLAHSGNSKASRLRPEALQAITRARSQFKFVVRDENDIDELLRDFGPHIDRGKIVLMPEGTDSAALREAAARLAEAAKRRGLRLLPRWHIDLWGNQRQV